LFNRLCAAALASAALASSADAGVLVTTYTGYVSNGVDNTGFWGLGAGADLAGHAFTAVYSLDDSVAGATVAFNSLSSQVYGYGASNPVTATLTINGVSWAFGLTADADGWYYVYNIGEAGQGFTHRASDSRSEVDHIAHRRDQWTTVLDASLGGNGHTPVSPDYRTSSAYVLGEVGNIYGSFSRFHSSYSTESGEGGTTYDWYGNLQGTSVSSIYTSDPVVVPEPMTWTLMIVGMGAAGAALRRRSAAV
jgi:hypothetical protein